MHQYGSSEDSKSEWVDIGYLHNKGLSNSTIEKLVQEDARFQRVNGNIVEYDFSKVYGHPEVRARLGGGVATTISYENILKNSQTK